MSAATPVNNTQSLAQALFAKLDVNGDNKLSADEFTNFLQTLLQTLPGNSNTTSGVGSASTAVSSVSTAASNASKFSASAAGRMTPRGVALADVTPLPTYTPINGWVTSRLNDPADLSNKYRFQRAIQDLGNPDPTPENLENLVIPYLQAQGMNIHLKQGSKDIIVIDDGPYTQDVIRDVGGPDAGWQYMNSAEAQAYHAALMAKG